MVSHKFVIATERPMSKLTFMQEELNRLEDVGLYNNIRTIESPQDAWLKIEGKRVLNMCSNNYLGLADDKRIAQAAKEAIDKYGVGPGAVRTIAGTMELHKILEDTLAEFKQVEATIGLQSGFVTNQAVIPQIGADAIFTDSLNHASIIDGVRLTKSKRFIYEHNDVNDLNSKLEEGKEFGRKLIITDGVFSMDGDIAPLDEIAKIAKEHDAILMVDDAHGEGVLGDHGRGIVNHFKLSHHDVDIDVGTLSKAMGVVGGYVAGTKLLTEYLAQKARPFLFSSATTIPDVAAAIASVRILMEDDSLVRKLWKNAEYFQQGMRDLGFDTGKTQTPITPVMLGEAKLSKEFSKELFKEDIFAMSIGFPTVPKGMARIRVMLSAAHSTEDLDFALQKFEKVGKSLQVI